MALIEWEDKLSVNVELFDEQHMRLVDMINSLYDGVKTGEANDSEMAIKQLNEYTIVHFGSEEALFQRHGYTDFDKHKEEHDAFIKYVSELTGRLNSGDNVKTGEMIMFLMDWLYKHILITDRKYSLFLNRKGVI